MFPTRPTGRGATGDSQKANQRDLDQPETCSVSIRRVQGTVVVEVHGAVGLRDWSRIDRLLTDIIDAQGNLDVLLDLWGVVSLERQAMPMIVDAARQARDHGGRLRLADRACREHRQISW